MGKFYGSVKGASKTVASRRGHDNIRVSAQSWQGSVIVELYYDWDELYKTDVLMVRVETSEGSDSNGTLLFDGEFETFVKKLGRKC